MSLAQWASGVTMSAADGRERFPVPRQIVTELDLNEFLAVAEDLTTRRHLNANLRRYLSTISILIVEYQQREGYLSKHTATGVEALKLLKQSNHLTQQDLAEILQTSRSNVGRILTQKGRITADHARRLADHFQLRADLFLE
ncbi:Helix-turn-helix domain protein [Mucisphaera calidilacus]|uniref:Helix-turn-helix domain protein n=2 Tax=Mucisphaera calidilacus TaxID=2527982 RepID=A0A518BXJ4_9BACT|nr:Helix-turn-helix domain protein [Mucisphaera calidilacus]